MKASISKGKDFVGLSRYVLDVKPGSKRDKKAEVVGGNMAGGSLEDISRQFAVVKAIRKDISNPVWHCSLSLPPGDTLDAERWGEVSAEFMRMMGFTDNFPHLVVKHGDKKHEHAHIVASRIGFDGKVWNAGRDVWRALRATQELEKRFGLTVTKGYEKSDSERRNPGFKERQMEFRTGEASPKAKLQLLIDDVLTVAPTAAQLCQYLEANGVEARPSLAGNGRLNGFSFSVDGIAFKGSSLGKAYGLAGLLKRGMTYDPERDFETLGRLAGRPAEAERPIGPPPAAGPEAGGSGQAPEDSPKKRLQELVRRLAADGPTVVGLCERLEASGVKTIANLASTGRLSGLTFTIDGLSFKGSSLGKAYSWGGLQKQGVTYEPGRDRKGLERFTAAAVDAGRPAAPPFVGGARPAATTDEAAMVDGRQRDDVGARWREADRGRAEDDYRRKRKGDEDKLRRTSAMMEAAEWERERRNKRRALEATIEEKLETAREVKGIFVIRGFFIQDDHGRVDDVPEWCYDKYDVRFSPTTGWAYIYQTGDDGGSSLLAAMGPSSVVMYKDDDESLLAGLEICRSRWSGRAIMLLGSAAFKSRVKGLAAEYFPEMEFTTWPWPWRWPWRWGRGEKSPKALPAGPGPEVGVPGPGPDGRASKPRPEAGVPGPRPEGRASKPRPRA